MSSEESEKFNLVFRGSLVKGFEPAVAKKNMGQLFKIDAAKVEALFSGKPVVLKRGLSLDVASKYRVAIKKAGALVDVEPQKAAPAKPVGKASFAVPADAPPPGGIASIPGTESASGAIPGTEPPKPAVKPYQAPPNNEPAKQPLPVNADAPPPLPEVDEGGDDFSLAPVGADLLKPEEHKTVVAVAVDTSALSLKDMSGTLLEASEYQQDVELELDLSEFDLAEAGADVLKPEERKVVKPVAVDIASISLSEPGGNLAPPKPAPPPPPDVSDISLEDR